MAKNVLPTNFQDDILNAGMDGRRRYRLIQNADGTVSLEDASVYDQVGSNFGAGQINATNTAVNESADKNTIIDNIDDIAANTKSGMIAGALALKEVNQNLGGNILTYNESEDAYYIQYGADSVPKKLGEPKIYYDYKAMINSPIGESKTWKSTISGYIIASTTWLSNAHVYVNGVRLNTGQIGMAKSTIKVGDTVVMTADACPGQVSMACIVVVGY